MPDVNVKDVETKKILIGVFVIIFLALFFPVNLFSWPPHPRIESIWGTSAFLLSAFVSMLAFIKFVTRLKSKYLFIASGFLGVAMLEGFSLVSSLSTGAFVWSASRFLLAAFLLLSLKSWREGEGEQKKLKPRVYISAGASALLMILTVSLVPNYNPYSPFFIFGRPMELLGVGLFAVAFFLYLSKGYWKTKYFEYWFLISLLAAIFSELSMALSFEYFDVRYNLANFLKNASYIFALMGLLMSSWAAFKEVEAGKQ